MNKPQGRTFRNYLPAPAFTRTAGSTPVGIHGQSGQHDAPTLDGVVQVRKAKRVVKNHIPVNAPKCPVHTYHRDGKMPMDGNLGRTPTYFPNSLGEWKDRLGLSETPFPI
jgi:hypothetical protein